MSINKKSIIDKNDKNLIRKKWGIKDYLKTWKGFLHCYWCQYWNTFWKKFALFKGISQTFISNTVITKDPIFYFDYLENIQTTPKFAPQSAHFNYIKKQSLLHCTVAHMNDLDSDDNENKYCYLFYFSDDIKHNCGFTFAVLSIYLMLQQRYFVLNGIIVVASINVKMYSQIGGI